MPGGATLFRYWHTIRHLRPGQILNRLRFRLARPKPDLSPAPSVRSVTGLWVAPAARRPSMLERDRFRFLNAERTLESWDDPFVEKLWRYNLHYFDDLNAEGAAARATWHEALIERWIAENPPVSGSGWEPYPTSLRIVNWVKFALAGNALSPTAIRSLAVQARWLAARIEWHLLGNHLFSNAKAILFAGSYFAGPEAESWRRRAEAILDRELGEQILPDGGHFERSPMYHALALEDVLDLINLARAYGSASIAPLESTAQRMRVWLAAMSHPDGEIGFFNDAAVGIAPVPAELEAFALRLALPPLSPPADGVTVFPDSGYSRVQQGPLVALIDSAPLGPDYLPAHGHADTLSFEVSFAGQRLLINSGTSLYGTSPERLRQRGTAAHNTLVIDGEDSSEVWGGFRVARRARPFAISVERQDDTVSIAASHDGYRRLPGAPVHRREWRFAPRRMTIEDALSGFVHSATAYFHIHPSVHLLPIGDGFEASLADDSVVRIAFAGGKAQLVEGSWHPEFGLSIANSMLVVHLDGSALTTTVSW